MGEYKLDIAEQQAYCHQKQHLTNRRYVGNTMAALVMQTLGCDVAALNTVQFSM